MKHIVKITRLLYKYVEVEANSKEEAKNIVDATDIDGNIEWNPLDDYHGNKTIENVNSIVDEIDIKYVGITRL